MSTSSGRAYDHRAQDSTEPVDPAATLALPRLLETALAAVVTMDDEGVVTGWNRKAEATFGWSATEVVGSRLVDLIVPPHYRDNHNRGLEHFRATGEGPVLGQVLELSAIHRDGHEFPVELRISEAARLHTSTVFIAFIVDITERKAREAQLVAAYEDARSSRQAIDEFVSMVVHELRQPMSVILGYADLLLSDLPAADEPRYAAPLRAILQKAEQATVLINDILTAAKLESGALTPRSEVFDLAERARSAVDRAMPAVLLREGVLSMTGDLGPALVEGDPGFVDTILDNLIGNAINYSPSSPAVSVHVRRGGDVELTVTDAGKGIAEPMHERIFERFVRVEDHAREPGTGLGLYVSRKLARLQNGSVELVSSRPGAGSCFALRLPVASVAGDVGT